jgi:RNA polymerase sigma-70 factor, ECF subfamily
MASPDSSQTTRLLEAVATRSRGAAERRGAFERLFERYRRQLLGVVRLRMPAPLRARMDPSDVVQEAYADAVARLPDYLARRPMPFRLWLRKTTQERLAKLTEHHFAARRSVAREIPMPEQSSILLARRLAITGLSVTQELSRREMIERLRQALTRLDAEDREILVMRYLEHLANQDIAALLEIDPAAASRRHGRALIRLGRLLRELGVGGVE